MTEADHQASNRAVNGNENRLFTHVLGMYAVKKRIKFRDRIDHVGFAVTPLDLMSFHVP